MCRVFGVLLKPLSLEELFFKTPSREAPGGNGERFAPRSTDEIFDFLQHRKRRIIELATDCTKRSTKAGYDAAGLGVGVIDIRPLLEALAKADSSMCRQDYLAVFERISKTYEKDQRSWKSEILISKDGGDYLETHQRLLDRLGLEDYHFIYAWTAHIRQASQGDMYSAVNAHPHLDGQNKEPSLFASMHNGDILDADQYKTFLREMGCEFFSNADSCVIPALQSQVLKVLRKNELHSILEPLAKRFQNPRLMELVDLAQSLAKNGAHEVTQASALVARIFEITNLENKFVFQSLSPMGFTQKNHLGGGVLNIVRGGFREGGEEGGEAMFYLPYPQDDENFSSVSAMVSSEENALKEQVSLIDLRAMDVAGEIRPSKPLMEELKHLRNQYPELTAQSQITAGGMPIFDVHPGEILELSANGQASLFDTFTGEVLSLQRMREEWPNPQGVHDVHDVHDPNDPNIQRLRQERMAHLKRFRVEYHNAQGEAVPSPFNTYGEEIIVVQPKALRDNTAKLFRQGENGLPEIIPGKRGLGLWMGTDDRADRANTLRKLNFKLVGAAGTSHLIAQIAENMCRKLRLNRIPTMVVEGFTASDSIPPNISGRTLFVANSNSGGTSDTIKLTRELTSLTRLCKTLMDHYEHSPKGEESQSMVKKLKEISKKLEAGVNEEDLDAEIMAHIRDLSPHVFVITNIEASPLGDMGRGMDERIFRPAGTGITNLPEEECVGSTFAAMASLQWLIALDTYLGEVRGHIHRDYAQKIYASLQKLPEVCDRMVNDMTLIKDIREFSDRCVGGNNDFIYTGYVNGIPEEQAHKFAEMIQTMAVGWHYFMFQHGKYAHVRRASRHALGSIVGHNVPPPCWEFFNSRALKAPREIKARAAIMFAIAHESDRHRLLSIPDYSVDYVFTYPEDDMVLYPFQVIIISHLISYYWGLDLKKISDQIALWNEELIDILEIVREKQNGEIPADVREQIGQRANGILYEMSKFYTESHHFDNAEVRRMNAIFQDLYFLSQGEVPPRKVAIKALMGSPKVSVELKGTLRSSRELSGLETVTVLKDLALELSNSRQAKRIADMFLTDENGRVLNRKIKIPELNGSVREMLEYDYWCQYEGLGEFYHVNPIHPPKIAKAKKGWL